MSERTTSKKVLRVIFDNDVESLVGSIEDHTYLEMSSRKSTNLENRAFSEVSTDEGMDLHFEVMREILENEFIDDALSIDNPMLLEALRRNVEGQLREIFHYGPECLDVTLIVVHRIRHDSYRQYSFMIPNVLFG